MLIAKLINNQWTIKKLAAPETPIWPSARPRHSVWIMGPFKMPIGQFKLLIAPFSWAVNRFKLANQHFKLTNKHFKLAN